VGAYIRMVDIHNYKKRLERILEKIKSSKISKQNKKDILDFHTSCFSEGISAGKIQRYVFDLEKVSDKDVSKILEPLIEIQKIKGKIYNLVKRKGVDETFLSSLDI
jgi:hypothetical protein